MFMLEAEVLHDVEQERRVYKEIALPEIESLRYAT